MDNKLDEYLDRMYAATPELSDGDAARMARDVGFICDRQRFLKYTQRKRQLAATAAAPPAGTRPRA